MDSARQLLDELMGRNRNHGNQGSARELHWEDEENCVFFLVSFCPHECFTNTKADLGACRKVHDEAIKKQFDEADFGPRKKRAEEEFLRFSNTMINDVERKIQKGKQRLMQKGDPTLHPTTGQQPNLSKIQEQINKLNDRIKRLVADAEEAGTRGDVDQAQDLMIRCDKLKDEREGLLKNPGNGTGGPHWASEVAAQEKLMEVCEVCGAFLIVGDAQQRIEDHLTGKQHLGYAKLRRAVEEVYERRRKRGDLEGGNRGHHHDRRDRRHRDSDRRFDRRDRDSHYGGGGRERNKRHRNRDNRGDNHYRRRSRSRS